MMSTFDAPITRQDHKQIKNKITCTNHHSFSKKYHQHKQFRTKNMSFLQHHLHTYHRSRKKNKKHRTFIFQKPSFKQNIHLPNSKFRTENEAMTWWIFAVDRNQLRNKPSLKGEPKMTLAGLVDGTFSRISKASVLKA